MMHERPECSICKKPGIIIIGRDIFCGDCAMEYQRIKNKNEHMVIMEEMKNAKSSG